MASRLQHDLLACMLSRWYAQFEGLTFKSVILPLPVDFIDWLLADGVHLEADSEAVITGWGARMPSSLHSRAAHPGRCLRPRSFAGGQTWTPTRTRTSTASGAARTRAALGQRAAAREARLACPSCASAYSGPSTSSEAKWSPSSPGAAPRGACHSAHLPAQLRGARLAPLFGVCLGRAQRPRRPPPSPPRVGRDLGQPNRHAAMHQC
jgi:hypothetical protein